MLFNAFKIKMNTQIQAFVDDDDEKYFFIDRNF